MAGDWIKVRCDLQSHPKVVRILSATKSDKFRVIGGLHAVWAVFDAHSEDGVLHGYTLELMDHIIGWEGFSSAMASVGWLAEGDGETLVMPEFTEHNGQSAKRRAEDQKRKRSARKSVRNLSEDLRTESGLEKRREEKNIKPPKSPKGDWPRFDEFWSAYPNKKAKPQALKAWNKIKPDDQLVDRILSAIRVQSASDQWLRDDGKFIPHPATWLNAARWEDQATPSVQPTASVRLFPGVSQ
jgi:hypothetical protein